jgi:hypothetical protein
MRSQSSVDTLSCASAGNCSAGGLALDSQGFWQAVVASERNGRWSPALVAPGTEELSSGQGAGIIAVSCTKPGVCGAGGWYENSAHQVEGFVISES